MPVSFALTAAAPLTYAAGFLLATASLHISGIAMGSMLRERFARLVQVVGMSIAAMGAWMLVTI